MTLAQPNGPEVFGSGQPSGSLLDPLTHFISYLDAGGLSYDQVSSSLRLFAEKVMPNFR